jgi:hypothetical protein
MWILISVWTEGLISAPAQNVSLEAWWNFQLQGRPKHVRCWVAAILIYTTWSLWKERNRRIFEGVFTMPARVFYMLKDEMQLRVWAMCGRVEGPPP